MIKLLISLLLTLSSLTTHAVTLGELKDDNPAIYASLTDITGVWLNKDKNIPVSIYFEDDTIMMGIQNANTNSITPIEITGASDNLNVFTFDVPVDNEIQEWEIHKIFDDFDPNRFTLLLVTHHPIEIPLSYIGEIGVDTNKPTNNIDSVYKKISLEDLLLDVNELLGTKIVVKALGSFVANNFHISIGEFDFNIVSVEIKRLTRDERKKILRQCGDTTCYVTVYGKVYRDILDNAALAADKVEFGL